MTRKIQLRESDIRRMVMEAINELTAQNAFDASKLAGQKAKEAEEAGDFDLADRKRLQRNNFMKLGFDKEDHPDRPVARPKKKVSKGNTDVSLNMGISNALKKYPTINKMFMAWIESIKNNEENAAFDEFNKSGFGSFDINSFDGWDDDLDDNEYLDNPTKVDNTFKNQDADKYKTPEYWGLRQLCMNMAEKNGFFNDHELNTLAATTYYGLTTDEDYLNQKQFNETVPEEERSLYTNNPKRGFIRMINASQYGELPDSEKRWWAPYQKFRNGETTYRRMKPKYDGKGNAIKASVTPEQIAEAAPELISYAFDNNYVANYAPVFMRSKQPLHSFNFCLKQAATHYLRKYMKDSFLQTEDSTWDGNGNEDTGFARVSDELKTDANGASIMNKSNEASHAMNELKEIFEFILNDEYMGDINKFSDGENSTNNDMKLALRIIIDDFNNVFNSVSIDKFNDLISKEKTTQRNGTETVYKDSTGKGMKFIKSRIASYFVEKYVEFVDRNEENTKIADKKLSDPVTKKRYWKKVEVPTSGSEELDKLCEPMNKLFALEGGRAVFNGDKDSAFKSMLKKLEPLWTVLGSRMGDEIIDRFKRFKRGKLKPLNNPGKIDEAFIRKIVSETLRRHLRIL